MRILLIEDDRDTSLTIQEELQKKFVVDVVNTGKEAIFCAKETDYDLIILDYVLPDINGIDVCRNLRKLKISTPILMLTAIGNINEKVLALDCGVDDYLTKPFDFDELYARIRALMRRPREYSHESVMVIGDLKIDFNKKIVKRGNKLISLRRKELYLLEYLAYNQGRVITREIYKNTSCHLPP